MTLTGLFWLLEKSVGTAWQVAWFWEWHVGGGLPAPTSCPAHILEGDEQIGSKCGPGPARESWEHSSQWAPGGSTAWAFGSFHGSLPGFNGCQGTTSWAVLTCSDCKKYRCFEGQELGADAHGSKWEDVLGTKQEARSALHLWWETSLILFASVSPHHLFPVISLRNSC